MFEDTEFPPNFQSIGTVSTKNLFLQQILPKVTWIRLDTRTSDSFILFSDINPSNVLQGFNTNFGFLSALLALSEVPETIDRIFFTKELNYTSEYILQAYHNGVPTRYKLDSCFPHIGAGFAFVRPSKISMPQELWPVFLEKMWAKKSGCYFSDKTDHVSSVLSDLTGAPCEIIFTCSKNLTEKLRKGLESKFIIVATPKPQSLTINNLNLNPQFSYSVLDFQVTEQKSLVLIKNPLGLSQLPGFKPNPSNLVSSTGTWVDYSSFIHNFDHVSILSYHPSYKYSFIVSNKTCFQVSIHSHGLSYFSLSQQQDLPLRLIIADENGYIKGKSCVGTNLSIEVHCVPGNYFIYTEKTAFFTLSVYSATNSGIHEIEDVGFFKGVFTANNLKNTSQVSIVEVCKGVKAYCLEKIGFFEDFCTEGFVFDVIENESEEFCAFVKIETNLKNLEAFGEMEFLLKPKSYRLLWFRQRDLMEDVEFGARIRAKMIPVKNLNR